MEELDITFLGIHLRLQTNEKGLINFINHFTALPTDSSKSGEPNIQVTFTSSGTFQIDKHFRKISRNIWVGHSTICIMEIERFPGFALKLRIKDDILYVDASYQEKEQNYLKKLFTLLTPNKQHHINVSIALTYFLVYCPLFYYLERYRNLFILHASAIEYKNKGVIFAGLGGIGKSTFSLGALVVKGSKFISDNLIFYDAHNIHSLPEPISLDAKSFEILKKVKCFLRPKGISFSHNRMCYQISPEAYSSKAVPKYLFWLQWAEENKILPLDKETCITHLLNINLLAKEVREYYLLATAFDLAIPQPLPSNAYHQQLSLLLSDAECFSLHIKPGDNLEMIYNETLSKIIL